MSVHEELICNQCPYAASIEVARDKLQRSGEPSIHRSDEQRRAAVGSLALRADFLARIAARVPCEGTVLNGGNLSCPLEGATEAAAGFYSGVRADIRRDVDYSRETPEEGSMPADYKQNGPYL